MIRLTLRFVFHFGETLIIVPITSYWSDRITKNNEANEGTGLDHV